MSLPGIFCRGQALPRPARQKAHSPQGRTAGTSTGRPTRSSKPGAGRGDRAGDLVAQDQRQRVPRRHRAVGEAEVGMAEPAGRDRDQHLARTGLGDRQVAKDQGPGRGLQEVASGVHRIGLEIVLRRGVIANRCRQRK
jgi:hypothetical protein